MLANTKRVYALAEFTVELRPRGWFFWRTYGDKADAKGPYSSIASVTLMIARQLQARNRQARRPPPAARVAVMRKFIELDGKRYAWKDILRIRREQTEADRRERQPALFALREDCRPASQQTARGRYEEPTLFKVD